MAKILWCAHCRTVLEEVTLHDRSVVVLCIGCDLVGNAGEVALGARLVPADAVRGARRGRGVTRGRRSKKI